MGHVGLFKVSTLRRVGKSTEMEGNIRYNVLHSFFLGQHLDESENRSTKESHVHLK